MKIQKILTLSIFSTILLLSQERCKLSELLDNINITLPQSFKKFQPHHLQECYMPIFLSPALNKKVFILKKNKQKYVDKLSFNLLGEKISIKHREGAGGDNNFIVKYKNQETIFLGNVLFVSEAGYFYLQGRDNYDYDIRKKFKLTPKGIKEVKQSAYLVNLECKLSKNTILYEKKNGKGDIVARLPKGRTVKVLLHDTNQIEDVSSKQYLVSTPFGLVGWVSSSSGYMQTGGTPLSCLLYIGA
jgi:hypothetical protein